MHANIPWLVVLLFAGVCLAAADPSISVVEERGSTRLVANERTIFEYNTGPFKPYVKQFPSPRGVEVLRDNVADHLHHHGLMFALAVDGVDFWAETPGCGTQAHRLKLVRNEPAGVTLGDELDWLGPKQEKFLREDRTIIVYRPSRPYSLPTWQSVLRPAEGRAAVKLTGSHYFGLGMRFPASMDGLGTFVTSTGKLGEIVRGEERNTPADWCAYQVKAADKSITAALFSHPVNPRHPTVWFTMPKAFAYQAATLNLWKEPMTLKQGETLRLRYGLAVWDEIVPAEQIEKAYRQWVEMVGEKADR